MTNPRVEALIVRLEKGHRKTLEIFNALTAEQWKQELYIEPYPWTVRDLLAHFVSSEEILLQIAQDVAQGGPGAPEDINYDTFNAGEQKRLAGRSPQELLGALSTARQTTLDWVSALAEADLDRIGRHPALGQISIEAMITAMYGHQLLHMRDFKRVVDA